MITTFSGNNRQVKINIQPRSSVVNIDCRFENSHILPFAEFLRSKNIPAKEVIRNTNEPKGSIKVVFLNKIQDPESLLEKIVSSFSEYFDFDQEIVKIVDPGILTQGWLRSLFGKVFFD